MQCVFPCLATLGISLGAVMVSQAILVGLRTHRPSSSWLCHVLSLPAACGIISFLQWECPEDSNLIWEFPAGNRASAHVWWESSCVGSLKTHTIAQVPLYTCPSLSHHFLNPLPSASRHESRITSAKNISHSFCGWPSHTVHLTWLKHQADSRILANKQPPGASYISKKGQCGRLVHLLHPGKHKCKLNKKSVTQMFPWIPKESMCMREESIEERAWRAGDQWKEEGPQNMCLGPGQCDCSMVKKKKISPCPPCCGTAISKMDVCTPQDSPLPCGEQNENSFWDFWISFWNWELLFALLTLSFKMPYFLIYSTIIVILA